MIRPRSCPPLRLRSRRPRVGLRPNDGYRPGRSGSGKTGLEARVGRAPGEGLRDRGGRGFPVDMGNGLGRHGIVKLRRSVVLGCKDPVDMRHSRSAARRYDVPQMEQPLSGHVVSPDMPSPWSGPEEAVKVQGGVAEPPGEPACGSGAETGPTNQQDRQAKRDSGGRTRRAGRVSRPLYSMYFGDPWRIFRRSV